MLKNYSTKYIDTNYIVNKKNGIKYYSIDKACAVRKRDREKKIRSEIEKTIERAYELLRCGIR